MDDSDAYDLSDPKSPGYYDRVADAWDNRNREKMAEPDILAKDKSGKWWAVDFKVFPKKLK